MRVAVWDTYVKKSNGQVMHFDILAPEAIAEQEIIFNFGKQYLERKGQPGSIISADECRFCHIAAAPQNIIDDITANGFSIIEMENCN
ncbi:hypothetical protein AM493_01300 [Flavobacterium akiainvivens]|uniref:DUF2024 domain-containing protein n=1 Tax=Flavobacterium akiainvivens TaxID=1202724 RepID=A0A0N0RQC9_9FLAO|nr:DUF2024 family protein [Flavobacterium akiainvivens]KOS04830.1 hypothetical protein AM493_01300 [Flavobacterium akiainvivens]SFQ43567.1 protein of unknown function [Flavobacterium akiainvivens]